MYNVIRNINEELVKSMDPQNTEYATTSLTDTMLHLHYRSLRDTINCPV